MDKPFVFGIPASGDYFTDRKRETTQLATNFTYGVNTILISPRRWGKTSLVDKARSMVDENKIKVVMIDIFACRTEYDFFSRFAAAVIKQTTSRFEEWVNTAKRFLMKISPRFSFGVDPLNDFSISFDFTQRLDDIDEILQLPEKIAEDKNIRIVICIDEFQQIGEFSDTLTFQKRLRTVWQHQRLTSYCLFGSKRHMMHEIFDLSTKPFYKFGDIINLKKIPVPDWVEYITQKFNSTGKTIGTSQAERICQLVDCNSSYVQQLSWIVWTMSGTKVEDADISEAYETLIDQNSALYEKSIEDLTAFQIAYLRAMADGIAEGFTTKTVINKYRLGSSANAIAVQTALQKKEIIYRENGKSIFCDPLFPYWLRRKLY